MGRDNCGHQRRPAAPHGDNYEGDGNYLLNWRLAHSFLNYALNGAGFGAQL